MYTSSRAAAISLLLFAAVLLPLLPTVGASGGGLLIEEASVSVDGDGGVGVGDVMVNFTVAETAGSAANGTVTATLTAISSNELGNSTVTLNLSADGSQPVSVTFPAVPPGQHQLQLLLAGDVGASNSSHTGDYNQSVTRLFPHDVSIEPVGQWVTTPLSGGIPSGNQSVRDGDELQVTVPVANSGEVAWSGQWEAVDGLGPVAARMIGTFFAEDHNNRTVENLLAELDLAAQQCRTIIYCDETLFSKKALLTREWSAKNTNLAVD